MSDLLQKQVKDIGEQLLMREPSSNFSLWPESDLKEMILEYPDIPKDYLAFLRLVGSGTVGNSRFMLYGDPTEAEYIYDEETAKNFPGIVLVGDNFAGDCIGFDISANWQFGWISSSQSWDADLENKRFIDFIKNWFLSDG